MVGQVERILRRRKPKALPITLLMTASVLAVAFMMVSTVWGAPVPKAMGKAMLIGQGSVRFDVKFTAFQDTPDDFGDHGKFNYTDVFDYYFEFDVSHVTMRTPYLAAITGLVTSSNHPWMPSNAWALVWALDYGEPGSVVMDRLDYQIGGWTGPTAVWNAKYAQIPTLDGYVIEGNINVQSLS